MTTTYHSIPIKLINKATYLYIKGCGNTAINFKVHTTIYLGKYFKSRVLVHTYAVSFGLSGFFPEKVSRSFPNTDVMFQHESVIFSDTTNGNCTSQDQGEYLT